MNDSDVLYSDVRFLRNKKKANAETDLSDTDVTYSEVKISKTKPSTEPSDVSQPEAPSPGSKVRAERAALVVVSVLLVTAVVALAVIMVDSMQTKELMRGMKVKYEADRANLTDLLSRKNMCPTPRPPPSPSAPTQTCNLCDPGWEQDGGECYYFSTDRFPWNTSRDMCQSDGADLVKIGSRNKQEFLAKQLRSKMDNDEDKFWIGLTDSGVEGHWLWVDGTPLENRLSFWRRGEPDNWNGTDQSHPYGEDCVRMGEKNGLNLQSWVDHFCEKHMKRVCSKPGRTGVLQLSCVANNTPKN